MKNESRNAWNRPSGHDTLLNGGLIAAGIVGLLLSLIEPAATVAAISAANGVIVSEQARG